MRVWVRHFSGEKAVYEFSADVVGKRSHQFLAAVVAAEAGEGVQCLLYVVK